MAVLIHGCRGDRGVVFPDPPGWVDPFGIYRQCGAGEDQARKLMSKREVRQP
jgi:hypothetical protein